MGDPFSVEPPRWLAAVAHPVDAERLGDAMGYGLAGLALAAERNPDTGERKGLKEGFYEARMNRLDPQWRLKAEALTTRILSERAQMAAMGAAATARTEETSAWMQDAPTITKWITASPEERKSSAPPTAKSKTGANMLLQQGRADSLYFTKQDDFETRLEQARIKGEFNAQHTARVADWNDALGAADENTYADIAALPDGGRQKNGLPTPAAISRLNSWRIANGMTRYGTKSSEYIGQGKLSPEQQVRLRDLEKDEGDLRKQIAAARVESPDKVSGLEAQLRETQQQRRAIARGENLPDTEGGDESGILAEAKASVTQAERTLQQAQIRGTTKDIKAAKESLTTARIGLGKADAISNGRTVSSKELSDQDIQKMTQWVNEAGGKPVTFYNEATGQLQTVTPELLRQINAEVGSTARPARGAQSSPQAEAFREAVGSAWEGTKDVLRSGAMKWMRP